LSSEFPNYSSGKGLLDIPSLAKHFLSKSRELYKNSSADELILAGQARLAVRARGSSDGCQYCGHCLSGCVYGSVYSTKQDLEKMVAEDKIDYLSGLHVIKVEEVNSVVEVLAEDIQRNSFVRLKFEKLFIGAGALNSTKILLESLGRYNERVRFKDSQKFLLPIISLKSFPIEWPNLNTFSSVYLESFIPKISERWVHMQVSPINDLFLQKIGIGASDTLKMHLAKPILKRMLFGWCGLHSDYSSTFDAELIQPNSNNAFSRLVLSENANLQHTKKAHDFAKNLSFRYARQGIMVSPLPLMSKIGGGNHIGSSFPMSENSSSFFSTDTLGRHAKWNSVHIIDSSTLPSIPGTTIALLTMANADRIAKNAFSE
jgi:hypothetical protein